VYYDNLMKRVKAGGLTEQLDLQFFPDNQPGQAGGNSACRRSCGRHRDGGAALHLQCAGGVGGRRGAPPDGGLSFFGAAGALARAENVGVLFFVQELPPQARRLTDAINALIVLIISGYVAWNALKLGWLTTGQTTGSDLRVDAVEPPPVTHS
jgi:hypothetical protein